MIRPNLNPRIVLSSLLIGCLLFSIGCDRPPKAGSTPESAATAAANAANSASSPGPGEKICFGCSGSGRSACVVNGCQGGQADCPGKCLKLSQGVWRPMNVPGHSPSELWITFRTQKGTRSWSQAHVGEVVVIQNGDAVNVGPCPVCSGTTRVSCRACAGSGQQSCAICSGKKIIPENWTPTDNPFFNRQPDIIRLTDGRVLLGRIAGSNGDERIIVTRDKKVVRVNASELLTDNPAPSTP